MSFSTLKTTASAVTFAFGLLAVEKEEQEKTYAHIKEVLGDREMVRHFQSLAPISSICHTNSEIYRGTAPS